MRKAKSKAKSKKRKTAKEAAKQRIICGKSMKKAGVTPAIALIDPLYPHNVAAAMRMASCYGVKQVWFTGNRLHLEDKKRIDLYLDQLKFTNKKLQEVVEKLTATETPPIIIIQSDHGMRIGPSDEEYGKYMKLFNNLKAYYFPDKGRNLEFETTTPVNSFRVLFNLYFDEDYELLEDKIYNSPRNQRDKFIDVTFLYS